MTDVLTHFTQARIIPVIRAHCADDALWGAEQLIGAGITLLELTWTVPDAARVVNYLVRNNPHISVGAGTMLSWSQYDQAKAAGAHWFISPMLDEGLTEQILAEGETYIPAVMTPSELYKACMLGAPAIKLFPAGTLGNNQGLDYFKALQGPFDSDTTHLKLIPTGGIALEAIPQWLNAGALAVGLGNSLISPELLAQRDTDLLNKRIHSALFFAQSANTTLETGAHAS